MSDAYICEFIRTPIGRFGGSLSDIRPDDLAAIVLKEIVNKHPQIKNHIDEVILGCANQAGEDNRNIARMSLLLAGIPVITPGITVNRLCASGMDAISIAARTIKTREADIIIAGGVESMSRAPFVMPKPTKAFSRNPEIFDTTMGWRFINKLMKQTYGVDTMPETAEIVAQKFKVNREDQDMFALRSQQRYARAKDAGIFAKEIIPISISQRNKSLLVEHDEHPRETNYEALKNLQALLGQDSTITAGNSSGINDGAAAVIIASAKAVQEFGLTPKAKIICSASSGVEPNIMGVGPVSAINKALNFANLKIEDIGVIELNEAFASQSLAVLRALGLPDNASHVNANGGSIALGHPLGMTGTRIIGTAVNQLISKSLKYALCTMCVGVGQGTAIILENVFNEI
ncbi:MAG: 3-oxoadipyl-CoA thiolase [Burkholderiales bacterium]|nr:3-oxoadipyl-CoA thiolase [Burkholderiales bacterium]